jgi:CheY-like chemotaxis protein
MRAPKPKKRVLIVEDDAVIGAMLQELLTPDYDVFVASDGAEGVSRAQSQEFDLLLTDLNLPDIDGFEVARNVRDITRNIKTVLHTASLLSMPSAAPPSHIDVVVNKGIRASELLSLLASLLDDGSERTASYSVPA